MADTGNDTSERKGPPGTIEVRSVFIAEDDIAFIDDLVAERDGLSRARYCRRAIEAQVRRDRAQRQRRAA